MVISGLSQPIAFDMGSEEAILRANMEKLDIDPEAIDVLFRFHFMATTPEDRNALFQRCTEHAY